MPAKHSIVDSVVRLWIGVVRLWVTYQTETCDCARETLDCGFRHAIVDCRSAIVGYVSEIDSLFLLLAVRSEEKGRMVSVDHLTESKQFKDMPSDDEDEVKGDDDDVEIDRLDRKKRVSGKAKGGGGG